MGVDAELEYQNRNREVEIRLAELDRERELAKKDVEAAEQSYATFWGSSPRRSSAPSDRGVISGIFKKTGDYVMPSDIIASIGKEHIDDAFIRFRVPSDARRPEVGDEVAVIRPGFPFDRKKAIVSGIGNTLGAQGTFIAEAEFTDDVDWPINALVRAAVHGECGRICAVRLASVDGRGRIGNHCD